VKGTIERNAGLGLPGGNPQGGQQNKEDEPSERAPPASCQSSRQKSWNGSQIQCRQPIRTPRHKQHGAGAGHETQTEINGQRAINPTGRPLNLQHRAAPWLPDFNCSWNLTAN
jgi:hypothetical protein